ncbi:MAG: Crp/Fnr family transcriptional regulator [Clostridia bacterium]
MLEFLKATPLFDNLEHEELVRISTICEKKWVSKDTVLFRQGEKGSTFYIIVTGSVKIYNESNEGKEKIITVLRDRDSFGEFSILDGEARSASVATMEDTLFLTISMDAFHLLLERNFSITFKVIQQLVTRLRRTNQHVMDLVFLDAKSQILKTLLSLASQHGTRKGDRVSLGVVLTDADIASMAGISAELTGYVLQEMLTKETLVQEENMYYLDLAVIKK